MKLLLPSHPKYLSSAYIKTSSPPHNLTDRQVSHDSKPTGKTYLLNTSKLLITIINMSRRPFQRRPPAIQVGQPRQRDLTFENTSLEPFLRQYTRMGSREVGGADKQFADEMNFSRRLVEEMVTMAKVKKPPERMTKPSKEKWWNASPEAISNLVTNIADPMPANGHAYPTFRTVGVSDGTARENRIIIAMILMHHARSDTRDGRDGGVNSGGLWLPPRPPALEAQSRARAENRSPIYPTWWVSRKLGLCPD